MRAVRRSITLLLIICLNISMSGCWGTREPDATAYVLAMGIDKGEINKFKITYLIANSLAIAQGEPPGKEGTSIITSVEVPSLFVGLDMANTYTGRRLTLTHSQLTIFSEELAREGVAADALGSIALSREIRGSTFLAIANGKADEIIKEIKPQLEVNPAKFIELIMSSGSLTGVVPYTQKLYNAYIDFSIDGSNAVIPLVSLSAEKQEQKEKNGGAQQKKPQDVGEEGGEPGDYPAGWHTAGDIPREGGASIEMMGGAAFKGNKMVGELNGNDIATWLMVKGDYGRRIYRLADPLAKNDPITMIVTQGRKPQIKVSIVDGKPIIDLKITLEGNMLSVFSHTDYQHPEQQSILEEAFTKRLREDSKAFIERTQKEYKSDLLGFGLFARKLFLTEDQWKNFHWHEVYEKAEVNVRFDFNLRRSGMQIKVKPIIQPEKGIEEGDQ